MQLGGTAEELLRFFVPARCQPKVFWNGFAAGRMSGEALRTLAKDLEGVEYYRDWASAPMPYKEGFDRARDVSRCGILALWMRRSP